MADFVSKEKRSKIMSAIRAKNTKPELLLRKKLRALGLRYRIYQNIKGKPDISFPREKIAIFIDGDFWHGYDWKVRGRVPKGGYWRQKILKNIQRDKKVNKWLKANGWVVKRFWEHEVLRGVDRIAKRIRAFVQVVRR